MYCKECGTKINENSKFCDKCGVETSVKFSKGRIYIPIISLILSIIGILVVFSFGEDNEINDRDTIETIAGSFWIYSVLPFSLGIVSINNNYTGKNMGIAALIISFFTGIGYIVLLVESFDSYLT